MTSNTLEPTATLRLEGVDATPAQTWNWLSINETSIGVPAVDAVAGRLPDWAQGVPLVSGDAAVEWLDAAAAQCGEIRAIVVDDGLEHTGRIEVGGVDGLDADSTSLHVGAGARATVTVVAKGGSPVSGSVLRVRAEEGASVTVDVVVAAPEGCAHIQALGASLADGASLTQRVWLLGGAPVALGIATELEGDRATAAHELRYLAGAGEAQDVTYDIRQLGRLTRSTVDAYGVLTHDARKTLRATIDLVRGCKGSTGSETETVLMAGDRIRNRTLPVILCSEDDVQGDHGATIGSLSPDQMGFLASRGLSAEDVVELAGQAIIDDAAGSLPAEASHHVVSWTRAMRGKEAAIQAADAAAMAHGTFCDDGLPDDLDRPLTSSKE